MKLKKPPEYQLVTFKQMNYFFYLLKITLYLPKIFQLHRYPKNLYTIVLKFSVLK